MAKEDKADEERPKDEAKEAESAEDERDEELKDEPEEGAPAKEKARRARAGARERRQAKKAGQKETEAPRRRPRRARRDAEQRGEWGVWPSLCLVAAIIVVALGIIEGLVAKNTNHWVRPAVNFVTVIFWLLLAYYTYKRDLGRTAGLFLGLGAYHILGALVAWLVTDSPPMAIVIASLGVVWFAVGAVVAVAWERERLAQAGGTLGMRAVEREGLQPFEWNVWVIVLAAVALALIGAGTYVGVSKQVWSASILEYLVAVLLAVTAYFSGRRATGVCGTVVLSAGGLSMLGAMVAWLVTGGEAVFAILALLAQGVALLIGGGVVLARAPGRAWRGVAQPLIGIATLTLFVAILGLLNFIGVRYGGQWKWDSTENKYYSLSDQTRQIVKALDAPVEIVGFYTAGPWSQRDDAERLYRQYRDISPKLKTALYDTRLDLAKVREYNPPSNNITIVKCGDNRKEVYSVSEQDITSAILEVSEKEKKRVYFLEGHGERAIEGGAPQSYTKAAQKLKDLHYDVETLNLISSENPGGPPESATIGEREKKKPQVPKDCAVLCIIGPKAPLTDSEMNAINDYLDQGGDAFVAIGRVGDPDLSQILSPWNVKVGDGYIIDPRANWFGAPDMPVVIPKEDHPILKDLQQVAAAFPLPRPVESTEPAPPPPSPYAPPPPQPKAKDLAMSSNYSWEETGLAAGGTRVSRDPDERRGPLSMVVVVDAPPKTGPDAKEEEKPPLPGQPPEQPEKGKERTRIVVVGTADLADDQFADVVQGNGMLFTNAINWMAERTKLISLPPKEKGQHPLDLRGNVRRFVILLSLILTPLCIAIVGGIVWWVRR